MSLSCVYPAPIDPYRPYSPWCPLPPWEPVGPVFIPPSPRDLLQQQIADLDRQISSLKNLRDSLRRRLSECYPLPPIVWPLPPPIIVKPAPVVPPSIGDVIKSIK